MTESTVADEGVRVTVTPSQASYFAGEVFSVTVTITNIRKAEALLPGRTTSQSATYGHKRGAHSVSYVPMARPPTSPGVRTAMPVAPAHPASNMGSVLRRGLVGKPRPLKGAEKLSQTGDPSRRRVVLTKSLSVSIGPHGFQSSGYEDWKGKSPIRTLRTLETSVPSIGSPHVSSTLGRSATLPQNHPHARKQSIMDGQAQIQDMQAGEHIPPVLTPNPSTSTFSLSLDPITEGLASPISPATPDALSPANRFVHLPAYPSTSTNIKLSGRTNGTAPINGHPRRPPHLGIGLGPPPAPKNLQPKTATATSFSAPNTELILYSYAQLLGTVTLMPETDTVLSVEQTRSVNTLRRELQGAKAIGGGSMNIASNSPNALANGGRLSSSNTRRPPHTRSVSLSSGLFSLLSVSSTLPSPPPVSTQPRRTSAHARSPSVLSGFFSSSTSSTADLDGTDSFVTLTEEDGGDTDVPLPTFDVPPAMIAVDLSLEPGQSRNYLYTLSLPQNLPPTYRGRTLRFQYEFVLGICRSASANEGRNSRVMRVPIRIYNYVSVNRLPTPYDLRWPVLARPQRLASKANITGVQDPAKALSQSQIVAISGLTSNHDPEDLQAYARMLLSAAQDPSASYWRNLPRGNNTGPFAFRIRLDETDEDPGCRESIEILTRNPKKVSYDVHKDGVKVAVLTFTKSAYRLGETALGVVQLNSRTSRARVLKLSAYLESHETLPASLSSATPSPAAQTRRVHAESHTSFVASTLRTTFSLDIPSDASPAFQVAVSNGSTAKPGGLEWKIRLCLLVSIASGDAQVGEAGVRLKHMVRDGPRGEWGMSWTAAKGMALLERRSSLLTANGTVLASQKTQSWTSFLSSALLGTSEPTMSHMHDGDEDLDEEDDELITEGDWREVRAEMVECEVPIRVWAGNTAYKASEVVFEV